MTRRFVETAMGGGSFKTVAALTAVCAFVTAAALTAQEAPSRPARPPRPPAPPAVQTAPAPTPTPGEIQSQSADSVEVRRIRPITRMDQDYTVPVGETVSDVVLIFGSLRVEGHVRGDAVVLFGKVDVAGTGVIDGDLVNVGGGIDVESGGAIRGDLVSIAGALTTSGSFSPGGEQVVIGSPVIGGRLRAFVPWVTSGLMLGRVIVPSLPWVWVFLGVAFLLALVLSLVFETPVRACADSIDAKPLTTFLTGLLVLLLIGPVSFLLAVSIVGIIVIPFLFCALLVALVIGKVAVARWLGWRILRESDADSRAEAIRSFVIGFAILTLAYMVPVLGIVTWASVSVLAIGGASATVFRTLRRENPAPPRPPMMAAPVPPVMSGLPPTAASMPREAMPIEASAFVEPDEGHPQPTLPLPDLAGGNSLLSLPRATFYRRVLAGLLDSFLVFVVFQLFDQDRRALFWFLASLTAYNAAFWTWRGTTIGGIIFKLRVVRMDGRPLVFGDSIIRGLSSIFSLLALGIGFLWIHLDSNRERQAWHDVIAGTVVVEVPASEPLR